MVVLFHACKKEDLEIPQEQNHVLSAEELENINKNFCSTPNQLAANDRGVGVKGKFWDPGTTLRIKFLNGHRSLQKKVFLYAKSWGKHANISFKIVHSIINNIIVNLLYHMGNEI